VYIGDDEPNGQINQERIEVSFKPRSIVNPPLPLYDNWSLSAATLTPMAVATILVLLYFSAAVLIHPFVDLPFHDDWTYAWSVEHLLKTGELRVLDWSAHYPFAQILWGSLFCLPYGFSFSALRVSTAVLAWLTGLALYGTLREFGRTRSESFIATVVLLINPVFFVLTFSFMTDVPFVSFAAMAFFFFARALCRGNPHQLWVGCIFGACAFFIRQIAIAIPGSLMLYVLFAPPYRSWKYILPPAVFCLLLLPMPFFVTQIFGMTSQYAVKTIWVTDYWLHRYEQAVPGVLRIFIHGGLALISITLPMVASLYRRRVFWGSVAALLFLTGCSILFAGEIPNPLEGMWQLNTLGKERHLLQGGPAPDFLPPWLNYPLFVLSLFSSAGIIVKMITVVGTGIEQPLGLFVWYTLIHFFFLIVLWLFDAWGSDRYSIVLLPPLIAILANNQLKSKSTIAGIAVLFVVSTLVTWNETQTSRATAEAVAWLRGKNVPFASIDAGYVFNGWNLYAHPENLSSGAIPERDVPLVTSGEKKPYVIAASSISGYRVLREYGWSIPFKSANYRIYVLEQLSDRGIIKDKVP